MKYEVAEDLKKKAVEIIRRLELNYIKEEDFKCIKSKGSSTRSTIARCHGLSKPMQLCLKRRAFYILEFLSERFDKLSEEDKIKTIIHELMHIPQNFGGGFRHHDFVTNRNVDKLYKKFKEQAGLWDDNKI